MLMQSGEIYSAFSRTFHKVGLLEGAVRYGGLAVEMLREYIGEDSEPVARARKYLDEVTEARNTQEGEPA